MPELNEYLKELENHLYLIDSVKNKTEATKFKPFNFTQTVRKIVLPEMLPQKDESLIKRKHLSKSSNPINKTPTTQTSKIKDFKSQTQSQINSKNNLFEKNTNRNSRNQLQPKTQSAKDSSSYFKAKPFKAQQFNIIQV